MNSNIISQADDSARREGQSKHAVRRARRAQFVQMVRASVSDEKAFKSRVLDAVDHGGLTIAHDGRPIKVDFVGVGLSLVEGKAAGHKMKKVTAESNGACQDGLAILDLTAQAIGSLQVRPA